MSVFERGQKVIVTYKGKKHVGIIAWEDTGEYAVQVGDDIWYIDGDHVIKFEEEDINLTILDRLQQLQQQIDNIWNKLREN